MESTRPDIIKLGNLIKNYLNKEENFIAKTELSDMTEIKGEDIVDALDTIFSKINREKYGKLKADYEDMFKDHAKLITDYEKLDKDYKKLINGLELILKDSLPEKIKVLIKEIKTEEF